MLYFVSAQLADTKAEVSVPPVPERTAYGTGWDWIDACDYTEVWNTVGAWGDDGFDLGDWPYVIYALARTAPGPGQVFGYAVYVEGDVRAHWFSTEAARNRAVTEEAFDQWRSHPSVAPPDLPAAVEDLPASLTGPWRGFGL